MKHLCFSRLFFVFMLSFVSLQAHKSAIVYLGEHISYPMVGVHDYIIVEPDKTNTYTHGFALYKHKIYARIELSALKGVEHSLRSAQKFHKKGFENFFIDIGANTPLEDIELFFNKFALIATLQKSKIIAASKNNRYIEQLLLHVDTLALHNASLQSEILKKIPHYKENVSEIIDIESSNHPKLSALTELPKQGVITYLGNDALDIYGEAVITPVKREILTIIDESIDDRITSSAHQYGALPLEYFGYIQKLHNIQKGLPDPEHLTQYHGVVIWLSTNYDNPDELISWVQKVIQKKIPLVFAYNFGFNVSKELLAEVGIDVYDGREGVQKQFLFKDSIMDYEIRSPLSTDTLYFQAPPNSKPLVTFKDADGLTSTNAAITPWGGYAIAESFFVELDNQNLWSINPFAFFKQALRLKDIPVPDTTTLNGNRLFFTHIDGDGIMNTVEFNPELLSGETIYSEILKPYKNIPHSVSLIGAEVMPNGLYPNLSKRLVSIAKKMYALPNVEPATHTFTHPFFWGKIHNGNLDEKYRLKPKGYTFSLSYEINGSLGFINDKLLPKNTDKKAKTVFWSGDCVPRENALEYVYKNSVLNINGGYTTINNAQPWLTLVAPIGIERGEFYQIYTGAQNENVFTNDWLGPFWGFKKVVQTFKLTDTPKRLKPIDVYYHLYSGSKKASLNALKYVFDWVLKQKNLLPLYTSEYIPVAMDYFSVSMAKTAQNGWLVDGMHNLKTLRFANSTSHTDFKHSQTVIANTQRGDDLYIGVDTHMRHHIKQTTHTQQTSAYIIHANAKLASYNRGKHTQRFIFKGYAPLDITLHLPSTCTLIAEPKAESVELQKKRYHLKYTTSKEATLYVQCK